MSERKIQDEIEARDCIAKMKESGMPLAAWARSIGKRQGVAFPRQVVTGSCCIADFAAKELHLVLEVDSGYHGARAAADGRRERRLERFGWRVVRILAEAVHQRFAGDG